MFDNAKLLSCLAMALLLTFVQKLVNWYTSKHPVDLWLELLRSAESFDDWEEAALHLDSLLGLDLWHVGGLPTVSM